MRRTLVLNVVGLSPRMVGSDTPHLAALAGRGALRPLVPVTPAVTCSVQASLLTGLLPRDHGVVGNGWYFRELAEVMFWRQSNALVAGEKIWEAAKRRDPSFTCAKLFWWYNMYSSADWSVTPRPQYPADGRKIPDCYTQPPELRDALQSNLGTFPLFRFWGPAADIKSSSWIADASAHVYETNRPTLTLVYLPHLDYCLQKLGPRHPDIASELRQVDALAGRLINMAEADGANVVVLSEYGITDVSGPVMINQALRAEGLLQVRQENTGEQLDAGASRAFAVVDHQLAHVYVRDPADRQRVQSLLLGIDGIETVWDERGKAENGLNHCRSGDLVAVAQPDRWFAYYHWLRDDAAPDYARTVDIHRKPGYDPVELFLDPGLKLPRVAVAGKLLKRKLGFRGLLDVIPLRPDLVKGSHGRLTESLADGPVFITGTPASTRDQERVSSESPLQSTAVKEILLQQIFGTS